MQIFYSSSHFYIKTKLTINNKDGHAAEFWYLRPVRASAPATMPTCAARRCADFMRIRVGSSAPLRPPLSKDRSWSRTPPAHLCIYQTNIYNGKTLENRFL